MPKLVESQKRFIHWLGNFLEEHKGNSGYHVYLKDTNSHLDAVAQVETVDHLIHTLDRMVKEGFYSDTDRDMLNYQRKLFMDYYLKSKNGIL